MLCGNLLQISTIASVSMGSSMGLTDLALTFRTIRFCLEDNNPVLKTVVEDVRKLPFPNVVMFQGFENRTLNFKASKIHNQS